jgi:hypothetical protein
MLHLILTRGLSGDQYHSDTGGAPCDCHSSRGSNPARRRFAILSVRSPELYFEVRYLRLPRPSCDPAFNIPTQCTRALARNGGRLLGQKKVLLTQRFDGDHRYPNFPNCTLSPQNWIPPWPTPPPAPPVPAAAFVGCFWDKGYPDHGGKRPCDLPIVKAGNCPQQRDAVKRDSQTGMMTLERCQDLCNGHRFFAVQNGGTGCFCGSTFGRYGISTNCTQPCNGDAQEICGGPGCNSIYRTRNTSTPISPYL